MPEPRPTESPKKHPTKRIIPEQHLTARDLDIIRRVRRHRLLRSRDHLLPLFGGRARALRRARRLADSGYLYRLPGRAPNEQDIFAIGNRGEALLSKQLGQRRTRVDWAQQNRRLGAPYIAHTLLVSSILVGIETACREREGCRFISEEEIARGEGGRPCPNPLEITAQIRWDGEPRLARIYADGVFGVEEAGPGGAPRRSYFFLEADRGTMPVMSPRFDRPSIIKKMRVYQAAAKVDRAIRSTSAHERRMGIRSLRTLFVAAPDSTRGSDGRTRIASFEAASRAIMKGQGSGLFLFARRELLQAGDLLRVLDADRRPQGETSPEWHRT